MFSPTHYKFHVFKINELIQLNSGWKILRSFLHWMRLAFNVPTIQSAFRGSWPQLKLSEEIDSSRLIGTKCSKITIPFATLRCVWVFLELMPVQILCGIQFMRCKTGEELASKCNGKWDSGLCTFPILAKRMRLRCTDFLLQNMFDRKNRRKLALGSRIEGM